MNDSLDWRRERRTLEARLAVLQAELGAVRGVDCPRDPSSSNTVPTFRSVTPTGATRMPRHVESARLAILESEARLLAAD